MRGYKLYVASNGSRSQVEDHRDQSLMLLMRLKNLRHLISRIGKNSQQKFPWDNRKVRLRIEEDSLFRV